MLALFCVWFAGIRGRYQQPIPEPGPIKSAVSSPEDAQQQRRQKDHDEDEEQDLRDFGCATRDTAETKKRRNDRDDEKYDSVSKHEALQRVDYRIGLRADLTPSPPCLLECADELLIRRGT
jgi:hypothetical protein